MVASVEAAIFIASVTRCFFLKVSKNCKGSCDNHSLKVNKKTNAFFFLPDDLKQYGHDNIGNIESNAKSNLNHFKSDFFTLNRPGKMV